MGLYIDITHYHILQSHSRYCYDLFCNNNSKKVYLKLIWVYSPKKWHSKQLKFASPYVHVACDLIVCVGRQGEWSMVLCIMWSCLWNLAVQCYAFQCQVRSPCSEIRNANLKYQKRNVCMQCVRAWTCNMFMTAGHKVHCEGLCIAIILMSGSYT